MPFTTSSPKFQESLLPKKIGCPKNVMINHHFPDKDCNRSVQIPKNIILLVGYIPLYPTISSHDLFLLNPHIIYPTQYHKKPIHIP